MISNWITPIDTKSLFGDLPFSDEQIGSKINFYTSDDSGLLDSKFAIIGINQASNPIRSRFYRMTAYPEVPSIIDLGNIANYNLTTLMAILAELEHGSIIPLFLGINQKDIDVLLQALYKTKRRRMRPIFIDDKIGIGKGISRSYLNPVFEHDPIIIDNLSILGYQQQYSNIDHVQSIYPYVHGLRLGAIRSDIKSAEPYIRDADCCFFLFDALKHAEAPAQHSSNPSGLYSEEGSQLAKYAGMNEKMELFAIGNYDLEFDEQGQTAELAAQLLWYFVFGYKNRTNEVDSLHTSKLTQYMVNPDAIEIGFIFYKSEKTGRWWVRRQESEHSPQETNILRACSYEDYLACTHNEISERLLELFQQSL